MLDVNLYLYYLFNTIIKSIKLIGLRGSAIVNAEKCKPTEFPGLRIRGAEPDEMRFVMQLAEDEGWNPGVHDGECFYHTGPDGFFVAELNGKPAGCISAVSYNGLFGFIGLFIVKPEHRRKGIGACLWDAAIAKLDGHVVGLDGVLEQEPYYSRYGFLSYYRNMRFEGRGGGTMPSGLVLLSDVPFEEILAYDSKLFSQPRPDFLSPWTKQDGSSAFVSLKDGCVQGYGLVRKCRIGYKIGPLFAEDLSVAERLFLAMKSRVPENKPFFLDVAQPNKDAVMMANKYGMSVCFETIRMYRGKAPDIEIKKVFGVTTFELG
jgi:GNAT superfamily N-acetyltransferase